MKCVLFLCAIKNGQIWQKIGHWWSYLPCLSTQFPVNRDISKRRWTAWRRRHWSSGTQVMELWCTWSWPPRQATVSPVRPTPPTVIWTGCFVARATLSLSRLWDRPAAASLTWLHSWSLVSEATWTFSVLRLSNVFCVTSSFWSDLHGAEWFVQSLTVGGCFHFHPLKKESFSVLTMSLRLTRTYGHYFLTSA